MTSRRGTTNTNARGGSEDRRRRRRWLVDTFGDGTTVKCHTCPTMLTVDTVTADRIIPGVDGGTYRRGNILPQCLPCARSQGGKLAAARKKSKESAHA